MDSGRADVKHGASRNQVEKTLVKCLRRHHKDLLSPPGVLWEKEELTRMTEACGLLETTEECESLHFHNLGISDSGMETYLRMPGTGAEVRLWHSTPLSVELLSILASGPLAWESGTSSVILLMHPTPTL